ncbi:MAG: hypothetical protein JW809_10225 [Pirellulales bacterium]|nr:hypothetical protein [Pirellulales bacterium]
MADESDTNAKGILAALSNPQFKETISIAVVLFFLLLFARELADPSGFRNYLIGALTMYLIGAIFLVQTQINLINHAINQAGNNPQHFPLFKDLPTAKRCPRIAHIIGKYEAFADGIGHVTIRSMPLLRGALLAMLAVYLFWRSCL